MNPEYLAEMDSRRRFRFIVICLVAVGVLLIGRLFYLQIVKGEEYDSSSQGNRIRILTVLAQRGDIYDCNGKLLVTSRAAYSVRMIDLGEEKVRQSAELLAVLLNLPVETILDKVNNRETKAEPVNVAVNVDFTTVTRVKEQSESLPGVYIDSLPIREYIYGATLAHVLGYIAEISQEDLDGWAANQGYKAGDLVGRAGLERSYESVLRGKDGGLVVEVDSQDNLIRVLERIEPVAGRDLHLTVDIDLQLTAEECLEKSLTTIRQQVWPSYQALSAYSGSLVMLENETGRILAMASYPDYDPNDWEFGVLTEEGKRLQYLIGSKTYPNAMMNRTVLAALAPGSIFKPITLAAALESGVLQLDETVECKGYYDTLDSVNPPKCWVYPNSHGWLTGTQAISHSCNSFFYEMGRRVGIDRLDYYASLFGLGEDTGFKDLLYEAEGDYSFTHRSNPEYKLWASENGLIADEPWYEGETIFSAIGQEFSAFTPLQMVDVMAQLANKGERYAPALVDYIQNADDSIEQVYQKTLMESIELKDSTWNAIQEGLVGVTKAGGTSETASFGTQAALNLWQDLPYDVAAKTGTAQVANDPYDLKSDAWFSAYAPADNPKIAITMSVEAGRSGSSACAPTVSQLIRQYFGNTKLNLQFIN
ncbi:MAG: penicillin-binding protein 2 [Negativicutes bacterium]|nr:penicillin-binding protein 2 [Negativicutes bacterium]